MTPCFYFKENAVDKTKSCCNNSRPEGWLVLRAELASKLQAEKDAAIMQHEKLTAQHVIKNIQKLILLLCNSGCFRRTFI